MGTCNEQQCYYLNQHSWESVPYCCVKWLIPAQHSLLDVQQALFRFPLVHGWFFCNYVKTSFPCRNANMPTIPATPIRQREPASPIHAGEGNGRRGTTWPNLYGALAPKGSPSVEAVFIIINKIILINNIRDSWFHHRMMNGNHSTTLNPTN